MKKSKIIGLSLISALLVFSLTNVSHAAAPPSYVGIDIGDSFTWIATANIANINSSGIGVIGAENWTLAYNELDALVFNATGLKIGSLLAGGMKMSIKNFTEEMEPYYPWEPRYVGVFTELNVSYVPDVWVMVDDGISYPSLMIVNPTGINNSNYHYILGGGMPVILPIGLNYGQLASWITTNITGLEPIYNNVTITGLSNGFRATVLGSFLEWALVDSGAPFSVPSLDDVVVEVTWNANGVLDSASLKYGGLTLVTAELLGEGADEIPGYLLPVFLGVGAIAIIGTISIIRRKKQLA